MRASGATIKQQPGPQSGQSVLCAVHTHAVLTSSTLLSRSYTRLFPVPQHSKCRPQIGDTLLGLRFTMLIPLDTHVSSALVQHNVHGSFRRQTTHEKKLRSQGFLGLISTQLIILRMFFVRIRRVG